MFQLGCIAWKKIKTMLHLGPIIGGREMLFHEEKYNFNIC